MLSADLGRTMYEFSLRIPPYYTLLVRTLSVLEVSSLPLKCTLVNHLELPVLLFNWIKTQDGMLRICEVNLNSVEVPSLMSFNQCTMPL